MSRQAVTTTRTSRFIQYSRSIQYSRAMRCAIVALSFLCCAVLFPACSPKNEPLTGLLLSSHFDQLFARCGTLGKACCRAPDASQNPAAFGPLVSCKEGLGCDISSNTCVSPCGGTGQVCCDGPETRAPKWTVDGKIYSPDNWTMREMCDTGACDRQSHRCYTCGSQDGGRCCPPDAAQATARCVGDFLECEWDPQGLYESGTCRACGSKGKRPCDWGCEPSLDIRNGLCDICGAEAQPPCDSGCKSGLGVAQGLCRTCGGNQQIPCDSGCKPGLGLKNGLCISCGGSNQSPCDGGCKSGTRLINGVCVLCGHNAQPPCTNGCAYPLKVAAGVCRQCGANGQMPCDFGCSQGLVINGNKCVPPAQSPQPENCSTAGQSCVPDRQPGAHCCQSSGPQLCVFTYCKPCIPHGQQCTKNQLCCDAKDGDVCRLDFESGTETCGIPD
jgi:hypothetical protein